MDEETRRDYLNVRPKVQQELSGKRTGFGQTLESVSTKEAILKRRIFQVNDRGSSFLLALFIFKK
jgi:hypothetical protein